MKLHDKNCQENSIISEYEKATKKTMLENTDLSRAYIHKFRVYF